MKNYYLLSVAILFLFPLIANSQKDKPTPVDITKAKNLKKEFEDDDLVVLSRITDVSFERNKKTNKVEVVETNKVTYLAISSRADDVYSSGYDNESEIEELTLYDRKNKKMYWELQDEAYSTSSIFHNDYRVKYGSISYPTQGYKRIVKEVKRYKDIKYFTSHYFSESYPVIKGTITFNVPAWLEVEFKDFHLDKNYITRKETKASINKVITYSISDLPASKRESAMPGSSFIFPHVLLLSKSFKDKDGKNYTLFKETKDLYNWYRSLVDEVEIDASEIKSKVQELIADTSSDEEAIRAIYYWVQDNIKYIAFEDGIAGFQPDAPQNVFTKRYGDCKGMAILLKTMLVEAGYDARLVWIGTDVIAYDYSMPTLSVDNHMITAIMIDGKPIFIDGTEKFNSFRTFASRIQGKQALIENGDDFILAKVPTATPNDNKEEYKASLSIKDSDISGKMSKIISGEQASQFLYGFTGVPQDEREKIMLRVLTDGNSNVTVENVQGFDPTNRDDAIDISYDLMVENVVSSFDDNLYLELDPVRYMSNWKMSPERKHSYLFSNTRSEVKNIELELPDGYSLESLPEAVSIDNEFLKIDANYSINGNKIIYNSNMVLKKRLIDKSKFELWNQSIEKVKNFYDEQIVLKKQ